MADFRLSAQVISRSSGRSSVAAAAYRAASRIHDARTDEVHDYTRKSGVLHAEILAPDNAPEWMRDRAQLWNAVERAERRKDAQLAREIQLSLPHELSLDDNRAMVRRYVHEQFVERGMIADVVIHAPSRSGDERNVHAHVMLTMRALTGEGFGPKNRDWNRPDLLENWRERWAAHQNREFERRGLDIRVDHRSFDRQGMDREPGKHLGPVAAGMERAGRPSEIGNDNRAIQARNQQREERRASLRLIDLQIEREKERFSRWAAAKREELRVSQAREREKEAERQARQRAQLERDLDREHRAPREDLGRQAEAVEERLQARGLKAVVRTLFGRTKADQAEREKITEAVREIDAGEQRHREQLAAAQRAREARREAGHAVQREKQEKGIERAHERREAEGWKPLPQHQTRAPSPPAHGPPSPAGGFAKAAAPAKPKKEPRPWEPSPSTKRPWEPDYSRPGRGRFWEP